MAARKTRGRSRLRTTRGRIVAAALTGLMLTPVLSLVVYVGPAVVRRQPMSAQGLLEGLAIMAALNTAFMIAPGLPLWIVCHRRGTPIGGAARVGALTGTLIAGSVGLAGGVLANFTAANVAGMTAVLAVSFGLIGAGVVALMWRIAYPPALQAPAGQVEVFA